MKTKNRSASALVVTLMFLVLIAVLVIGFMTTAGLERQNVQMNAAKMQANLYAAMATDVVAGRIQEATNTADAWWISQPGRIAREGTAADKVDFFELHSGKANTVVKDVSINLNPASLISGRGLIADDPDVQMPIKWTYVYEDGTQEVDPTSRPTYDKNNPVIGRYAFWTDDLSGRLNLNTATSSIHPTNEIKSHPSRVALDKLPPLTVADVTSLRTWRHDRLFESVEDIKAAVTTTAADERKMDLTHYSHSPSGLNIFGEEKIVLTTKEDRANGAPFFDILTTPNADPGINANIDATKFNNLFATLYGYFNRKDWPVDSGKSFIDKYGKENAAQIVLNLIDYVRSAEAESPIVEASRGDFDAAGTGAFRWGVNVFAPRGFMGNARRPLITQMGVWISDARKVYAQHGGQSYFEIKFRTEIYWPSSAGDSSTEINLRDGNRRMFNEVAIPEIGSGVNVSNSTNLNGLNYQEISSYGNIEGATGSQASRAKMKPGEYRTITMTFPANTIPSTASRPVGPVYLRSTIRIADNPNVGADIVPLMQDPTGTGQAKYELGAPGDTSTAIQAIFTNDPVVNKSRLDWTFQGSSTFDATGSKTFPASTLGQTRVAVLPQQDTDSGNKITDDGFGFPAFKGTSKNPHGMVESLAELGRIHTGGKGPSLAGVPWRTLRLQPRAESDHTLPDWLLLDLFALPQLDDATPDARNKTVLYPHGADNVGGLINVNTALYPFSELAAPVARIQPMSIILQSNGSGMTQATAEEVVDHIAKSILADNTDREGRFYGATDLKDAKLYFTPEQLVEIKGVADGGESDEKKLDAWLSFLSARGSVYSVFAIGQKIVQLPDGTIVVQAESRTETLLERKNGSVQILSTKEMGL